MDATLITQGAHQLFAAFAPILLILCGVAAGALLLFVQRGTLPVAGAFRCLSGVSAVAAWPSTLIFAPGLEAVAFYGAMTALLLLCTPALRRRLQAQ